MTKRKPAPDPRPRSEIDGAKYYSKLLKKINESRGQFLRAEDGGLHLVIENHRVPLSYARDNLYLAYLMLWGCSVSSLSAASQVAIQRLQTHAFFSATNIKLRFLGALSEDHERLYIPIASSKLLQITGDDINEVENGSNRDKLWVEHPTSTTGSAPFVYSPASATSGLAKFELLESRTVTIRGSDADIIRKGDDAVPSALLIRFTGPRRFAAAIAGGPSALFSILRALG